MDLRRVVVLPPPPAAPVRASEFPVGLDATRAVWLRHYARFMVLLDATVLLSVAALALFLRFGTTIDRSYALAAVALVPVWLAVMTLSRCYETRFLGNGTEEFKRVANACFRLAAVVVFLAYGTKTDLSRGFLAIALSGGLGGVVAGRLGGRLWLHRQRRRGSCVHKVVVVGAAHEAIGMIAKLRNEPLAGLSVVGACLTGDAVEFTRASLVPVLGQPDDVLDVLTHLEADTVCVAGGPNFGPAALRRLAHRLEGTGVDLLVSPLLTDVTGSRLSRRQVSGLPLLHVEEPELGGSRRIVKGVFDRAGAFFGLLLLLPFLLGLAVVIRATSPGPALFSQQRVGRDGKTFRLWKFRSMYVDAEERLAQLTQLNLHGATGVLFKMEDDPRVTKVGRIIRRYSVDELPQLLNVLFGHMSLVGPRPPLPQEVDKYEGHVHRRLMVKPGLTGLWQVSGRADLAWDDAVRLDLHYVENWSLGLDVAILAKTAMAVVRPSGAY
jgi:exopolysaccharide biosynthesis polyprenyl glycosylphosphotransferase